MKDRVFDEAAAEMVAAMIANDEELLAEWTERAVAIGDASTDDEYGFVKAGALTPEDVWRHRLSAGLKHYWRERSASVLDDTSIESGLLRMAVDFVDWGEVAETIIQSCRDQELECEIFRLEDRIATAIEVE